MKAIYTLGYSVSLISLTTGSIILCLFRKLHCTRNYIHLNLFLSFILRAVSVLVKDDVLYSSSGRLHCPDLPFSWVGCKLSLVFFQYCIMANFYWLLVEGLYLHTLLVVIFAPRPALPGLPPNRMGHPHRQHGCVGCGPALAGGHGLLGHQ